METKTEIDPQLVRQLRDKTNAGIMDCKRALAETGGDLEKAEAVLRTKGIAGASKKASRATKEGIVASYIHLQGKVGVLVEVNCETDFVAKNEKFREFVKDITLHIAAAHPLYVNREEVPAQLIESERAIYQGQVKGKPENVIAKIVDGKLDKFYSTV
ncbi:MAG: elongation factor Ts, partial [Verrucomicrobiota bacterium]